MNAPLPIGIPDALQALDAEAAVLGGVLMVGADGLAEAKSSGLAAADFSDPLGQTMFAVFEQFAETGASIDIVSVHAGVRAAGRMEQIEALARLTNNAAASGLHAHGELVRQAAGRRRVRQLALGVAARLETDEGLGDASEWSSYIDARQSELANLVALGRPSTDTLEAADVMEEMCEQMAREAAGDVRGISTGFPGLNRRLGGKGPRPGWLVLLAARPKMGKTTFALSMTRSALFALINESEWIWAPRAQAEVVPVLWACDEMRNTELMQRLVADVATLEGRAVANPSKEWLTAKMGRMRSARQLIDRAPLSFVADRDCGRLERIFSAARTWRSKHRVSGYDKDGTPQRRPAMLVIDYLQRMTMAGMPDHASREERVSAMAKACKSLARELDVLVVLVAQLNRDLEKRPPGEKRPRSSDLRESGALEQEADAILGVYRPIRYDPAREDVERRAAQLRYQRSQGDLDSRGRDELAGLQEKLDDAEIIVMDNRHGPTGIERVRFVGEHYRFAARREAAS